MDGWEGLKDGLLENSQTDGDSLEILSSCGYIDVIWLQFTVVDDGFLYKGARLLGEQGF